MQRRAIGVSTRVPASDARGCAVHTNRWRWPDVSYPRDHGPGHRLACRQVADRCRALPRLRRPRHKVAPFKPQNMSNNAGVTADGGEIGRAQMLQARAARVPPSVHMNPVLLKPEIGNRRAGDRAGPALGDAGRARIRQCARASCCRRSGELRDRLRQARDLVLVEGAGSPAEINLRAGDIANMGFAEAADVPVILVGDIDRGGVIAALVGTHAVLEPAERERIKGFLINTFRGDVSLFDERAGGDRAAHRMALARRRAAFPEAGAAAGGGCARARRRRAQAGRARRDRRAAAAAHRQFRRPRSAARRAGCGDRHRRAGRGRCRATATLCSCPARSRRSPTLRRCAARAGTSTSSRIAAAAARCLAFAAATRCSATSIADPEGVEGRAAGAVAGLGLLDVETVLGGDKTTAPVAGRHVGSGEAVSGYEIHLGRSDGPDCARPFLEIDGRPDGAVSADGLVAGTYVHGLFASDGFRRAFLHEARRAVGGRLRGGRGGGARRPRRASRGASRPRADPGYRANREGGDRAARLATRRAPTPHRSAGGRRGYRPASASRRPAGLSQAPSTSTSP